MTPELAGFVADMNAQGLNMHTRALVTEMAATMAAAYDKSPQHWLARTQEIASDDRSSVYSSIALTHWVHMGLQSVELGHKLAAALMATSATDALEGQRLPWPAFEIKIPGGLLPSSIAGAGDVFSVFVSEFPEYLPITRDPGTAGITLLYFDTITIGHISLSNVAEIARYDSLADALPERSSAVWERMFGESTDDDHETRVRTMLARLVTGVILLINTAREDKATAYPQLPRRPAKRGQARVNTHRVDRSLTIDCTHAVREFVTGASSRGPINVTTLVRGHWRQQPHGEGRSLRRKQWIMPFWKGDGPLAQRAVKVKT